MRTLFCAALLCSPLLLTSVGATPALADSAIEELRATEAPPAAPAPAASPAPENGGAADPATRPTRRHKVAGSHYERERLRHSQIHG